MSRDRARNVPTRDLVHDLGRAGFESAKDSGNSAHSKWIGPHGVERVAVNRGGSKDADPALVKQVRRAIVRAEYRTAGLTSGLTKGTKLLAYFVEVFETPLLSARSYADRLQDSPRSSAGGLLSNLAGKGLVERVVTAEGIRWAPPGLAATVAASLVLLDPPPTPTAVEAMALAGLGDQAPPEAPQEVEEVEAPPEEGGAPPPPPETGVDPLGDLLDKVDAWRLDHGRAEGDVVEALALLEDSQGRVRDLADRIEKGEEVIARYRSALQAVRDLAID